MTQELTRLTATMNLCGLSRRDAARSLNLSYSALNKKLRGEIMLYPEEKRQLYELATQHRRHRLERQGDA